VGPALAALLALALPAAAASARAAETTPQQQVEGRLMCYCGCSNLTVRDCSCGTSASIRGDIAARLASGQTADQVVAAYVSEHGEQIRSAPEPEGFNLVAWVMPFAVILAGMVMVVALTRRWQRRGAVPPPPDAAGAGAAALPADRAMLERIEREMRDRL
jgi:cytochrome c-type biogenesis protein CcmH/NrfF